MSEVLLRGHSRVMAATFVEVTLDDMDRFLKRAYRSLEPRKGEAKGEVYYDLNLSDRKVLIRVWTSIHPHSGVGAGVGADAIRVTMISSGGRPLMPKSKIVKRTKNWRNALEDRIEEFHELYETKTEYWKAKRRERDGEAAEPVRKDEPARRDEPERPPLRPPVDAKPPTSSGDTFEGGYRKLKNGNWGIQIYGKGSEGDVALGVTQGGKKTRVRLLEKDWAGPDRYKNNEYSEIWSFESASGQQTGTQRFALDAMVESIAARYLSN